MMKVLEQVPPGPTPGTGCGTEAVGHGAPRSRSGAAPGGGADQDQAGRSERSLAAAEGTGPSETGEALRGG